MVSFIIVNYRTYKYTRNAIESIFKYVSSLDFEVLLVDNASNDGSIEKIKKDFNQYIRTGNLKIIESNLNGGFSYANNLGFSQSKGDHIILLNSDAEIKKDVIQRCIKFLDKNRNIGAITAKLVDEFGELDQGCKRGFPNPKNAIVYYSKIYKIFPKFEKMNTYKLSHLDENTLHSVDAISGAFMVIPRKVINEVGFFDETFFMYGEDLDLCYRIKSAGYGIIYNPKLGSVIHYKGMSGKKLKWKSTYEFYRAMWIFYDKHYKSMYPTIVRYLVRVTVYMMFIIKITTWKIGYMLEYCSGNFRRK